MVLTAIRTTPYNVLLFFHIVSIVVAFAPAVIHPIMGAQIERDSDEVNRAVAGHMVANSRRVHFPALLVAGFLGLAMVLTSNDIWNFGQTWVSLAFVVWIAICGVVSGIVIPAERKLADGVEAAKRQVALGGQIATLLLLVLLYLMIWKPQ